MLTSDNCTIEHPYDILFLLCSNDATVIDRVFELWDSGKFSYLVISGGVAHQNDLLKTKFGSSEAEYFGNLAISHGISQTQIILEDRSMNTGENIAFTRKLLSDRKIVVDRGLMVQKPHMEKRCIATAGVQWPEVEWDVTSNDVTFSDYCELHGYDYVSNIIVGDAWRLIEYPKLGYQVPVEISEDILKNLNILIEKGFDKHVPKR